MITANDTREQILTDLLLSPEIEQLEGLLGGFNIFEAIGAVNRELRHSDFLAYLLEPGRPHGLGSRLLRDFVVAFFSNYNGDDTPSLIDVGCYQYESFTVYREWKNIDLLIVSELHKLVIAIENKIWSGEHSNQLTRYQALVEAQYPDYLRFYGFLTPSGLPPENNENWQPISYQHVSDLITRVLNRNRSAMGEVVVFSLEQYLQMLERHILEDSEISRLCQKIYAQHRQALDLIFEHRPDQAVEVAEFLKQSIEDRKDSFDLELDHSTKSCIRFAVKAWDAYPQQKMGQNQWTSSDRVLLFEFINRGDYMRLVLVLGPGKEGFRQAMFDCANQHKNIFSGGGRKVLSPKFQRLFSKNIIPKGKFSEDDDQQTVESYITAQLDSFFANDFPRLISHVESVLTMP